MTLLPSSDALATGGCTHAPPPREEAAPARPSVALYDEQALTRAGLAALLRSRSIEVVGTAPVDLAHSFDGALSPRPDVTLVAIADQGVELAHRLSRENGSPLLLMLNAPPDGDRLLAVAATGADGAVCRECPPERVVRAIRSLAAGAMFFECAHRPPDASPAPQLLSQRECHVALELARGAQTEEIAETLCISPHTVRTHVRNIKRKLGARTCAQAVALAITMQLVTPQAP